MEKHNSKILSVVVPVYNTEIYLQRCLDSLFVKEILDDLEIILVNDGSKDSSSKILREYEKVYPDTVVFIDKENGGHGSTINAGLRVATGKFFRVLDSDDWVNSIDLIKFIEKLKRTNADLVVTNYRREHIVDGSSELLGYRNIRPDRLYNFDTFNLDDLEGEYFVMATSTYKTDILREASLELLEKTFYVDMQYNTIPFKCVKTFIYFDLDIYRYYIGRKDQSVNTESFVRNKVSHEIVIKSLIDNYVKNRRFYSKNKKKYIRKIITLMLYTHYVIYCTYDRSLWKPMLEVKNFDKYLLKTSKELYLLMNEYRLVYWERKFRFIPVLLKFIYTI